MGKHDNPTKYPAIDAEEYYLNGKLVEFGNSVKATKVSPLKPAELSDPDKLGKKLNEVIGALKAAGMMDNE